MGFWTTVVEEIAESFQFPGDPRIFYTEDRSLCTTSFIGLDDDDEDDD